jgi:predicted dinucleotide-binding enzyme
MSSLQRRNSAIPRLAVMLGLGAAMLGAASAGPAETAPAPPAAPLKIGIIGTGHIGGTLATLWVAAGHEVLMSSRHPQELQALAKSLGPRARVGTPQEAAQFGGKIVLDTGNPYPERDGPMALEARRKGTGVASAEYLPGVRLVRAFNAINSGDLRSEAHRKGAPIAIPLAGDDRQALQVAEQLVRDAGFAPVVVGNLSRAHEFDVGTSVYTRLMTEPQLRQALALK